MKELMLMLASIMTRESALELLKKEVANYESDPSDEAWSRLGGTSSLILAMDVIKHDGGIEHTLKRMESMSQTLSMQDRLAGLTLGGEHPLPRRKPNFDIGDHTGEFPKI